MKKGCQKKIENYIINLDSNGKVSDNVYHGFIMDYYESQISRQLEMLCIRI